MNKSKLKDSMGRALTQSLFLELGYNVKYAVFTLDDDDKIYKGKVYPSLKKIYLEVEDPVEYQFAKTHLLGWAHWLRLYENKLIQPHIDMWRIELELAIRSSAVREIIDQSAGDKGYQAAKWLADHGWIKRAAGRPSKAEIEREKAIKSRISNEFEDDFERLGKDEDLNGRLAN